MKIWTRLTMIAMVALMTPACALTNELDGDEDVGEAEQAVTCVWNYIRHYSYTDATGTYRWDVSLNLNTSNYYVDERRIGGGFYKQYNLTPTWTTCPTAPESITLTSGQQVMSGPHNCLPNGNEEVHLDKQRLLVRQSPFITYECL